jgi:hypothetical protein
VDRATPVAFGEWCSGENVRRLPADPFDELPRADEKADRRRRRRALTADELERLIEADRLRPLQEAQTVRRGQAKGKRQAKLWHETPDQLEVLGRGRARIYKALVLTGLRKKELASLTDGQLRPDGPVGYAELESKDEKNSEGSDIPIRADLAEDLRGWLDENLARMQDRVRETWEPVPARLPSQCPVFDVPDGLIRILDPTWSRRASPRRTSGAAPSTSTPCVRPSGPC